MIHVRNRIINTIKEYLKETNLFNNVVYDINDDIESDQLPSCAILIQDEFIQNDKVMANNRPRIQERTLKYMLIIYLKNNDDVIKERDEMSAIIEDALGRDRARVTLNNIVISNNLITYNPDLITEAQDLYTSFTYTYEVVYRTYENNVSKTDREL